MASGRLFWGAGGRLHRAAASIFVVALVWAALLTHPALAQVGSDRYSAIVVEASSGHVISAVNADEPRHPASLTKMMTLYMVFEALRDRRITLDQPVPISPHAASMEPSKLGLLPGMHMTVEEGILGLVTKSANDAASALGELLGGDEDRFAEMMTLRARALGMSRTVFRNASGLPDIEQVTTARDLAMLGQRLVQDFPIEYRYFSTPSFVFHGRTIYNHDSMLLRYPGADGMKTGYIEMSGHNLVTSAVRGDVRLIGVVMGARSNPERDINMAGLLDAGFEALNVPIVPHWGMQASVASAAAILSPRSDAPTGPGLSGGVLTGAVRAPALRAAAAHNLIADLPRPPHQPNEPVQRADLMRPELAHSELPRAELARWGVQIGSFPNEGAARQAALAARRAAGDGEARVEETGTHARFVFHAQLGGFTETGAREACASLARHHMACAPVRLAGGQLASR